LSEKQQDIGALWIETGKNGEYLSGSITINGEKHEVVCFRNDHKKGKQPDYRVFPRLKKQQPSSPQQPDETVPF